jgi:hypothetical protein
MWVVELNVKGHRFTHHVLGTEILANERLRAAARGMHHRMTQLRDRVTH